MIPSEPYQLPPNARAAYAIWSRLLSCLVTESLLRAFYLPLPPHIGSAAGIMVILSTNLISENPSISRALVSSDIYAIVPLYHEPILKLESVFQEHGSIVALVDPLDMLPEIYKVTENPSTHFASVSSEPHCHILTSLNLKLNIGSREPISNRRFLCPCASSLETCECYPCTTWRSHSVMVAFC